MSAIDDYFDVQDAYKRWERADTSWHAAVCSRDVRGGYRAVTVASEQKAERAATRLIAACDYLAEQARHMRENMLKRGWTAPRKAKRQAGA